MPSFIGIHKEHGYIWQPYRTKSGDNRYRTKLQCPICKKLRWIAKRELVKLKDVDNNYHRMCKSCNGQKRGYNNYLEGKDTHSYYTDRGYVYIKVNEDDPLFDMCTNINNNKYKKTGYVLEHRYIMAQYMGRPLKSYELVHHQDEIRHHNNINNLYLSDKKEHWEITRLMKENTKLKKEIMELKEEFNLLTL